MGEGVVFILKKGNPPNNIGSSSMRAFFTIALFSLLLGSCSEPSHKDPQTAAAKNESSLSSLSQLLGSLKKAEKEAEENKEEEVTRSVNPGSPRLVNSTIHPGVSLKEFAPDDNPRSCSLDMYGKHHHNHILRDSITGGRNNSESRFNTKARIHALEAKMFYKRTANTITKANREVLREALSGHTTLHSLVGNYHVLVIPVQFSDIEFERKSFFENEVQDHIFGTGERSLRTHYLHSSLGKLNITGEVAPIITLDQPLSYYGASTQASRDRAPKELVIQAIQKLKSMKSDEEWWESFDNWDLFDYDLDNHRREPDGFIDAIMFIYAGKSQAACQSAFDRDGSFPAVEDVPPGPRQAPSVECYNRIWPHRWNIALTEGDPRFSKTGPALEGIVRPSLNALKITDKVFALDYNMQSEYSDLSTFIHELGHSFTLPDVYDKTGPGNSSGYWEVMSSNTKNDGQEFSSYSKISLGWIEPKIVREGQNTSAYLGHYNFVSNTQRESNASYDGPEKILESFEGREHSYDINSLTPGFGEPVYRALAIITEPSKEELKLLEMPQETGTYAAYSGRFDGQVRTINFHIHVPETGDAILTFDAYHSIETETNFFSKEEEVKVVVDYDLGQVIINEEVKRYLRTVSGDRNEDTLNESNPKCEVEQVLAIRKKIIDETATPLEKIQFQDLVEICQQATWEKHSYDLSEFRGKEVKIEIIYATDAAYTELGIIMDNFKLGEQKFDFENSHDRETLINSFVELKNGVQEVQHSQMYLMEYRDQREEFLSNSEAPFALHIPLSFNKDNNIKSATQAMLMDASEEGESLESRFRLVSMDYQPGVLVWYFNSKYSSSDNSPVNQNGQGYLLVLNSNVKELHLPGILSKPELLNDRGEYNVESETFQNFVKEQRDNFVCFSAIDFYTYINGEAPDCSGIDTADHNRLNSILFGDGRPLTDTREGINQYLPMERANFYLVGAPMRTSARVRTGMATFRPASSEDFAPFTVYKVKDGELLVDRELTDSATKLPPVSEFQDSLNALPENRRFQGDTVVVEKRGLSFKIAEPSSRIQKLYRMDVDSDDNSHYYRRPRAKVLINWE